MKDTLEKELKKAISDPDHDIELQHPIDPSHGDYATNIAMRLAKKLKKPPLEIAKEIVKKLPKTDLIDKVEAVAPGFVNFHLNHKQLAKLTLDVILKEGDNFGTNDWGKGKNWAIEHTSPNPNKAMHLGHLRNNITAVAISNIWEFSGIKVYRDAIDNNRGIAIAKLMWGYLKFAHKEGKTDSNIEYWYKNQDEWMTPEDEKTTPDKFVDALYVKGAKDFGESLEVEQAVRKIVVDWEAGDKTTRALWKKVLDYSYEGQQKTLKRLGNKWDKVWHESDIYEIGKNYIKEGLKKGIFKKDKEAIITQLEKYKIPNTIVTKSDGTALYITQDIALTKLKIDEYKADKLFWVVGPEQRLALQQFFAITEQLGHAKLEDLVHLSYGWMSIKGQGKMSSRLGNTIFIDDLVDQAKAAVKKKIDKKKIDKKDVDELSEQIALGALKYSILKVGRTTDTEFDFDTSLSFEGDSGPYLQYTHARARSILKEVENIEEIDWDKVTLNEEEATLVRHIYKFGESILSATTEYAPNHICAFLFELAQRYNSFYNKHSILKAEKKHEKNLRLVLTKATTQVLQNGLTLLGIAAPDKM